MEDPALVTPSRIERLLELACAYNLPLSVHTESGEDVYRYKSRMLDISKTSESRTLIIDQPVPEGPTIALRPNLEIKVFFAVEQGRYAFDGRVLRKTDFELGNRKKITALEITYPNALKSGQRRAYYRVPIPLLMPIEVDCAVLGNAGAETKHDDADTIRNDGNRLNARTINLSVGGMLIEFEEGDIGLVNVGAMLAIQFSVARNETPLKLHAIIRRVEKKSATEQIRAGIEFIDTEETFEYKLAINRLYRYVAERQREILLSGSQ